MVSKIFGNLINPINLSYNWAKEFDLISFSGYCSNLSLVLLVSGRDVDTSMFLRTVASPETLNG
jgi:hypothetical protein